MRNNPIAINDQTTRSPSFLGAYEHCFRIFLDFLKQALVNSALNILPVSTQLSGANVYPNEPEGAPHSS